MGNISDLNKVFVVENTVDYGFDTYVTGGTYNDITNTILFTNNTGGTFTVTGITSGDGFDTYVTGGTYDGEILHLTNNSGETVSISGITTNTDNFVNKVHVQNDLDYIWSAGSLYGFDLIDNEDGSVTISSGVTTLRISNNEFSSIVSCQITGSTIIPLEDNITTYVISDYNNGTPIVTASTSVTTFNCMDRCLIYKVARHGNLIYWLYGGGMNIDSNRKLRRRFLESENLFRASGLMIGAENRHVTLTSGIVFFGLNRVSVDNINTALDGFTQVYKSGDTWVYSTQTEINNTQYNNNGTLTTLNNNHYRVDYVYLLLDNPNKLYVVLGDAQYNQLTTAELSKTPQVIPSELHSLGLLVGRVIIMRNSNSMLSQSPFNVTFSKSNVTSHNELSELQGGESGQYYHLNSSERTFVQNAPNEFNKYLPLSGGTVSGDVHLNGNISSTNLSGSTSRLMEVSSGGTVTAIRKVINAYIPSGSTVGNLLEDSINWNGAGTYTGQTISGTYQGQKYYNNQYLYEAVDDNIWVRLIRG